MPSNKDITNMYSIVLQKLKHAQNREKTAVFIVEYTGMVGHTTKQWMALLVTVNSGNPKSGNRETVSHTKFLRMIRAER